MSPSILRSLVCFKFPPRLLSRYTGMLLVVVLVMRYGLGTEVAGSAGEADVEALAIPKKHLTVDGRGSAKGRRKERDMAGRESRNGVDGIGLLLPKP